MSTSGRTSSKSKTTGQAAAAAAPAVARPTGSVAKSSRVASKRDDEYLGKRERARQRPVVTSQAIGIMSDLVQLQKGNTTWHSRSHHVDEVLRVLFDHYVIPSYMNYVDALRLNEPGRPKTVMLRHMINAADMLNLRKIINYPYLKKKPLKKRKAKKAKEQQEADGQ